LKLGEQTSKFGFRMALIIIIIIISLSGFHIHPYLKQGERERQKKLISSNPSLAEKLTFIPFFTCRWIFQLDNRSFHCGGCRRSSFDREI